MTTMDNELKLVEELVAQAKRNADALESINHQLTRLTDQLANLTEVMWQTKQ